MSNVIKLSDMIKNLTAMEKKYGDLPCIYSSDDEGNAHQGVYYSPTPILIEDMGMHYLEVVDNDVEANNTTPNAVCIN